jgi:glycosyltransferase involved in cell wall biosynthesis
METRKNTPFISICIPASRNTPLFTRLLDSIAIQSYRDFEVVVSDNSGTPEIRELLEGYNDRFPSLVYYKTPRRLNMGENWNTVLSKANGEWLKMIHDDDWFSNNDSLAQFALAAQNTSAKFVFSDYTHFYEHTKTTRKYSFPKHKSRNLIKTPEILIAQNIIGNPSCTMVHRSLSTTYDTGMVWRIDVDYYIRVLRGSRSFQHIAKPLIHIGMNEHQMTKQVQLNPAVELPEAYHLLSKNGTRILHNFLVYDVYWRIFRNMHIFDKTTLHQYCNQEWGAVVDGMIRDLGRCDRRMLGNGFYSKLKMSLSFIKRRP